MKNHMTCWTIDLDSSGQLFTVGKNETVNIFQRYSRFKFGSPKEVEWFSENLYQRLKFAIEEGELTGLFAENARHQTYIYFTAPGIRNVPSASNLLLQSTGIKLNRYLARTGRATGIIRPLTRLASGRSNYAELTKSERGAREKTTQTLIPSSDYKSHTIHVLFFDDLVASGSTVERACKASLKAGAASFTSCSLFNSTHQAAIKPEFEHELNSSVFKGVLDDNVAACLSEEHYKPVQRMLRLLLHPSNTMEVIEFINKNVTIDTLIEVCNFALSNDYLTIIPQANGMGLYGPSLNKLISFVDKQVPGALS